MEKNIKIRLKIADRIYPMTISPKDEEGLRAAASKANNLIKHYEKNYAVKDKQDVLAMCVLQFASTTENKSIKLEEEMKQSKAKLARLSSYLDDIISDNSFE